VCHQGRSLGLCTKGFGFVVSHISRETSEIWGTQRFWKGRSLEAQADFSESILEGMEFKSASRFFQIGFGRDGV